MSFYNLLASYIRDGLITAKYEKIIQLFYEGYVNTLKEHNMDPAYYEPIFVTYLQLISEQIQSPYSFAPYHQQVIAPFDYYHFGVEFIRPLVDMSISSLEGIDHLKQIEKELFLGNNVIFLANHQIEADPQAISILLEKEFPLIAQQMIFVAGERVITDPLAIPFSMGRNLLCIYSKRYIDHPPELKTKKQMHNKKTMELMSQLLSEGGKCIYVAPSGGRDRPGIDGTVEVAPFDAQSIEMFHLMAQKGKKKTLFHPLSLATYDLLPPPETIQIELGEVRRTKRGAVHAYFGQAIDMDHFPGSDLSDKHARRQAKADYICSLVKKAYSQFPIPGVN